MVWNPKVVMNVIKIHCFSNLKIRIQPFHINFQNRLVANNKVNLIKNAWITKSRPEKKHPTTAEVMEDTVLVVVDIAGSNPKALMKTVVMGGACRPDHFLKKDKSRKMDLSF